LHNGIQREGKRIAVHEAVELNPATGSRQVKVAVGVERGRCGSVRHAHGPGQRRTRHLERVKPNVRSVSRVEVNPEGRRARSTKTGNVGAGRVAQTGRFVLADGGINAINADDTADSEDGVIGWVNDVQVSTLRSDSDDTFSLSSESATRRVIKKPPKGGFSSERYLCGVRLGTRASRA